MDTTTLKRQLISLIQQKSYREGNFTLSSGKKSAFYIDLKATTLHSEGAFLIGRLTFQALENFRGQIEGVGGLTLGADPIATAVSLAARAEGFDWPAFIVRKDPKAHGTSRYIEGIENLRPGARVVALEDVVTTGASHIKAVERLRNEGYDPIVALTIVDRGDGGREKIEAMGVKFISLLQVRDLKL